MQVRYAGISRMLTSAPTYPGVVHWLAAADSMAVHWTRKLDRPSGFFLRPGLKIPVLPILNIQRLLW
jgi:hypothetical protein